VRKLPICVRRDGRAGECEGGQAMPHELIIIFEIAKTIWLASAVAWVPLTVVSLAISCYRKTNPAHDPALMGIMGPLLAIYIVSGVVAGALFPAVVLLDHAR
jgi:hypothetical protein